MPTLPSGESPRCEAAQFTASSITSVTSGVMRKRCRSGAATVSTPYPVAARSSASPTRRASSMPSRCTPGTSTMVRENPLSGSIEAGRDGPQPRRHADERLARERGRSPRRHRRGRPLQIGRANDEAQSVEIGESEDDGDDDQADDQRAPSARAAKEACADGTLTSLSVTAAWPIDRLTDRLIVSRLKNRVIG